MFRDGLSDRGGVEHFDWALFIAAALVAVVGVVNLYSATSVYTQSRADLYVSQVYFLVAGGALAVFVAAVDYRVIERYAWWLYGPAIVSLAVVLALAKDIRGASRWINIGGFSFQPSEFMKLVIIIALGRYFQDAPRTEAPRQVKDLAGPALITGAPVLLVLAQPDLGTALILSLIALSIIALLRVKWWSPGGALLALSALVGAPLAWEYGMRDYQKTRLLSFIAPEADIRGVGYHAHNARIAIGNGGLFGQGYMRGSQNQFHFLPDQYTDFPFPVFAEDWGFLGSIFLIALYGFLVLWALKIASQAKDRFGAVVAVGVGSLIFWHAIFNLGMVTGLLPVVGVTLPLFSYGGSSVLTVLIGLGLLMNVSIRRPSLSAVRVGSSILR